MYYLIRGKLTVNKLSDVAANTFLNIKNLDAEHDGKYKVTI
jgi:hypothetical protein